MDVKGTIDLRDFIAKNLYYFINVSPTTQSNLLQIDA